MIGQRKMIGALMAVAVLAAGCGPIMGRGPARPGPASIEGKLAVKGRQAIAANQTAADGVDQLITDKVLTTNEGLIVLRQLKAVNDQLLRLPTALRAVDEAVTEAQRVNGLARASSILKSSQAALASGLVKVGSEAGRAKAQLLLQVVSDALLAVALAMPAITDPPGGATLSWTGGWQPAWA